LPEEIQLPRPPVQAIGVPEAAVAVFPVEAEAAAVAVAGNDFFDFSFDFIQKCVTLYLVI
jgi:hypothetical protein